MQTLPAITIPEDTEDIEEQVEAEDSGVGSDSNDNSGEDDSVQNLPAEDCKDDQDSVISCGESIGDNKKHEEAEDPGNDSDSAVYSEEDDSHTPQLARPLCGELLGNLTAISEQHIKDNHTLTNAQTPETTPVEPILDKLKGYMCDVTGRMIDDCLPTCLPGRHYTGPYFVKEFKQREELEKLKNYKWEPHTCKEKSPTFDTPTAA